MNARKRTLGLDWRGVHTRAGKSHNTLRNVRLEERVDPDTLHAFDDALGFERGSLARVKATQDPTAVRLLDDPAPTGHDSMAATVEGAEWLDERPLEGGGVAWTLTRIIDGRPASMSIADFDSTPIEEIRQELREVMNEAEVRQRRRLARKR